MVDVEEVLGLLLCSKVLLVHGRVLRHVRPSCSASSKPGWHPFDLRSIYDRTIRPKVSS